MKERPILFKGDMVRAILDGRKSQTRRIVKPTKDSHSFGAELAPCEIAGEVNGADPDYRFCPYGEPGDRLWLRETWQEFFQDELPAERRNSTPGRMGIPAKPDRKAVVAYRADGELTDHPEYGPVVWRPSVHMPRWASRITLEVVGVRVERLQDISKEDAEAEGIQYPVSKDGSLLLNISSRHSPAKFLNKANNECFALGPRSDAEFDPVNWAKAHFAALWESINGAGSWDANPWVWVVEFQRVPEVSP